MEDTKWLLARPTVFPAVMSLAIPSSTSPQDASSISLQALMTPEILGLTLLQLIYPEPQDVLVAEVMADIFIPPSFALATRTLFSVLRLNRSFYSAVMNQQDLFLRLAWQHGWMLPISLLDWQGWPNGPLVTDNNRLCCQPDRDWRGYLLKFLRKADPHARNRWRFHRQFSRGWIQAPGQAPWRWSCGEPYVLNSLTPSKPWSWELGQNQVQCLGLILLF